MTTTACFLATCGLVLLLPWYASAQTAAAPANSEPITLKDLKTPASPAFQLLGIAPTDVERPTTPRAFAVSLLSAFQKSDTVLPNGFALDVAPYWLVPHNRLEFGEYINPGVAQSIRQTFSISVASTKATTPPADPLADLLDVGVGLRTSIFPGQSTPEIQRLRSAILVSLAQASIVDALIAQIGTPTRSVPTAVATTIAKLREAPHLDLTDAHFDEITRALEEALGASTDEAVMRGALLRLKSDGDATRKKAALELQLANQRRIGFTLDVAGAVVTRTQNAQRADARLTREGLWLTTGFSDERLSVLGLVRFVRNSDDPTATSNLLDSGIRFIGSTGALNVSFEAIYRNDRSTTRVLDSTWKAVANIEYKISEDITLTSAFGKDFKDTRLGLNGATITLLGVNFGLGPRPALPAR